MIDRKCDVKKVVYTSVDRDRPFVVVMFEGRHNHPPWPEEKPTQEAKQDLQKCLEALGILGVTAEKLNSGTYNSILTSITTYNHYLSSTVDSGNSGDVAEREA